MAELIKRSSTEYVACDGPDLRRWNMVARAWPNGDWVMSLGVCAPTPSTPSTSMAVAYATEEIFLQRWKADVKATLHYFAAFYEQARDRV